MPAGGVSNEIVHVTDLYATLARIAGAEVPDDRPIDGVDQLDFLLGRQDASRTRRLRLLHQERAARGEVAQLENALVWEPEPNIGPNHLETPWIFNLVQDPKEETDVGNEHSWVRRPMRASSTSSRRA